MNSQTLNSSSKERSRTQSWFADTLELNSDLGRVWAAGMVGTAGRNLILNQILLEQRIFISFLPGMRRRKCKYMREVPKLWGQAVLQKFGKVNYWKPLNNARPWIRYTLESHTVSPSVCGIMCPLRGRYFCYLCSQFRADRNLVVTGFSNSLKSSFHSLLLNIASL